MNHQDYRGGHIEVICGPMFAGKTEELIRRTTRLQYARKKYVVFKPVIDNRYSTDEIVSHSQYRITAISIHKPKEIYQHLYPSVEVVVVDEIQFFDESIIEIIQELADKGLRIICAGLDCDFKGQPFGVMPKILAIAEEITKLTAICMVCGEVATRTQRLLNGIPPYEDDPIIKVGATEAYEARCRHCHRVLKREE